jgi:hypothetical protein
LAEALKLAFRPGFQVDALGEVIDRSAP